MMNFLRLRERHQDEVIPAEARPEKQGPDEHLVSLTAPASFAAEQYRVLRHIAEQMHKDADLRLLAVTSPAVGDGKTTTALNLAGALAQAPKARVLLVDADLRRGQVREHLRLRDSGEPGLAETILNADLPLAEVVRHCTDFNLFVLPAGRCPAAPYEALKSPRLGELLQEMRRQYDYVVFDTAPVLAVPDTRVLAKRVDGFFMVVAAHKTPQRLFEEAFDVIDPAKMLGLVFNGDDRPGSSYSSYGYGYGLYSAEQSGNGNRKRPWRWMGRTVRRAGPTVSPP